MYNSASVYSDAGAMLYQVETTVKSKACARTNICASPAYIYM